MTHLLRWLAAIALYTTVTALIYACGHLHGRIAEGSRIRAWAIEEGLMEPATTEVWDRVYIWRTAVNPPISLPVYLRVGD